MGGMTMISLEILRSYAYRRTECRMTAVDACSDTADYWGIAPRALAQFLIAMGMRGRGLDLI
jgi:hypothetical protein